MTTKMLGFFKSQQLVLMNDASQNIIVNILKTDWNFELKFGGNFLYMICFKLSRVIEQYFNIYFLMKILMRDLVPNWVPASEMGSYKHIKPKNMAKNIASR